MCFFIGIEDLAANALIQVLERDQKRFLTYQEIEKYGSRVVECLQKNGKKAILILSRESTNELFRNYSEFFVEEEIKGEKGISLKANVSIDSLIEKFRGYLALDVLLAFVDETTVDSLVAS